MGEYINPESRLAGRFWDDGKIEGCPVYDFHGHMHEMPGGFINAGRPEQMLATMERAGIKRFIFCSHLALFASAAGESANLGPIKKYGGPLRAYMAVRSYDLDFDRDIKLFEANEDCYAGFKFLTGYFNVPVDSPLHEPYWEYANAKKLICLSHTWDGSKNDGPENLRAVADKYPDVTLVCGHSFKRNWDAAIKLANEFPNIYLELTAVLSERGALEKLVAGAGSEKILFGCDLPWFSTFYYIGCLLDAEISDDDRLNILHKNGEKLLARFNWA
ncbi:MAG: amidohydrolase family protein [Defluviitaleaceae bacterium]|nr:amidohydrolase family protein [Defluviitaleaceae bacterium]